MATDPFHASISQIAVTNDGLVNGSSASDDFGDLLGDVLEIDVSDMLGWKTYYIRKGFGTKQLIVNHEPWRLTSILN